MTSQRAYRASMTQQQTLAALERQIGTKLDQRVFAALERVVARHGALSYLDEAEVDASARALTRVPRRGPPSGPGRTGAFMDYSLQ